MDLNQYVNTGSSLKAEDLQGREATLTVKYVDTIQSKNTNDNGETYEVTRVRVYFKETEKSLILNKTNLQKIINISSLSNSEKWPGMKITIIPETTNFAGKIVSYIRVAMVNGSMASGGFQMHQVLPPEPPEEQQRQGLSQNQQNYNQAHQPQGYRNQMPSQQGGALGQNFSSKLDDEIPF